MLNQMPKQQNGPNVYTQGIGSGIGGCPAPVANKSPVDCQLDVLGKLINEQTELLCVLQARLNPISMPILKNEDCKPANPHSQVYLLNQLESLGDIIENNLITTRGLITALAI